MTLTDEAAFCETFKHHAAKITAVLSRWTGRLSVKDREALTADALAIAFAQRGAYNPRRQALAQWFETCVQAAADKRPYWRVETWYGPRYVLPKHLRRET